MALPRTAETALPKPAPSRQPSVPDVVAPPPRHPRFPLFDGLRAIAVLCVLVSHIPGRAELPDPLPRLLGLLNVGVVIFFVISGFLLYRPFIAARGGGPDAPAIADYAKRRFLRIVPAYWLVLTVLTIVPGVTGVAGDNPLPQYALVHTLPVLGGPACLPLTDCGLGQTWSLVTELTFYAVLPLFALAAGWITRRLPLRDWMRGQLAILAVLAAISTIALLFVEGSLAAWIDTTVLGTWLWFALGMALAVASVAIADADPQPALVRLTTSRPGLCWIGAIAVYVVTCFVVSEGFAERTTAESLAVYVGLGLVAFLVVLPGVFGWQGGGFPRRVLAHPLVAWIGLISYGIFLWHLAIAHELGTRWGWLPTLAATLVLSVAVAAASYYLLERPILRLKYTRLSELLSRR